MTRKQRTPVVGNIVQYGMSVDQTIAGIITAVHGDMLVELTVFEPHKMAGFITQSWTNHATGQRYENDYRLPHSPDDTPRYGHWNFLP